MNKLPWIISGCVVLCLSSMLLARQGVVVTIDGKRFEGDITDKGTYYEVMMRDVKNPAKLAPSTFPKGSVKDIIYADQVAEQVRQQVARLEKRDVAGRIALAKFAMDNAAYDSARDVLTEAKAIEPNNNDINALLDTVNTKIQLSRGEKPTAPATRPAETAVAPPTTKQADSLPPKRLVTVEEINRIRQLEWNKQEPMKIAIDRDVLQKFIASAGITPAEFARVPKEQQAIQILNDGRPELAAGVHLQNDPLTVADFKKLQRILLSSCGTAGCHAGANAKGGSFVLFTGDQPAVYYTNYLILQTFTKKIDNVQKPLIDRQNPESSLLLEYMLPPDIAKTPHPPTTPPFRGAVKTKTDPRIQETYRWITELPGILPGYNIDLTTESPKKDARGGAR